MRHGFTLIELLIVLAILSLTMAIIVPSFAMMPTAQVALAAKDALRLMRYARNMALQTQQPITLTFSPGAIRLTSPFDEIPVPADETRETGEEIPVRTTAQNAVQAGDIETVAIAKEYDKVGFSFLGYDDVVSMGRSVSGRAADFRRHTTEVGDEIETAKDTEANTFSITVRANGTTRPFSMRVHARDADNAGGDVVSFDFLCSGTIGDAE